MSVDGGSDATVKFGDPPSSADVLPQLDRQTDSKSSTDNIDHMVHTTFTPPPARDVTNDVRTKMADDWLRQLVGVSSMLSRLITLEYFNDGAALTKSACFGFVFIILVKLEIGYIIAFIKTCNKRTRCS